MLKCWGHQNILVKYSINYQHFYIRKKSFFLLCYLTHLHWSKQNNNLTHFYYWTKKILTRNFILNALKTMFLLYICLCVTLQKHTVIYFFKWSKTLWDQEMKTAFYRIRKKMSKGAFVNIACFMIFLLEKSQQTDTLHISISIMLFRHCDGAAAHLICSDPANYPLWLCCTTSLW